jgi:hypothetical protein
MKTLIVELYQPSKLHSIILQLDQKLVITTKFDKIYETYCYNISRDGFKVITYDFESLVDEIRSENRLIIKAHGSIDNISEMIFTRSQRSAGGGSGCCVEQAQYHRAKRE